MIEAHTLIASHGPRLLAAVADTDPEARDHLAMWIIGALITISMVADHVSAVWDRLREKPGAALTYATKAELSEVHRRVDGLLTTVTDSLDLVKTEVHESIGEVNDAVKDVRKESAEILKSLGAIHRSLGRLEGHNEGGHHHE